MWALFPVRFYTEESQVTIETDHQALDWLLDSVESFELFARWLLHAIVYEFDIIHLFEIVHRVADALSKHLTIKIDKNLLENDLLIQCIKWPIADKFVNEPKSDAYYNLKDEDTLFIFPWNKKNGSPEMSESITAGSNNSVCRRLSRTLGDSGIQYNVDDKGILEGRQLSTSL